MDSTDDYHIIKKKLLGLSNNILTPDLYCSSVKMNSIARREPLTCKVLSMGL